MSDAAAGFLLALPAIALVLTGLVPSDWANRHVIRFRKLVTAAAALQALIAISMGIAFATDAIGIVHEVVLAGSEGSPIGISVYYDGVACLMFALVSFVGWVICHYSIRYLDGERSQGRYYRWTGMTIGAVSLMVISGNLLMFLGCWVMTSLGLHQLLLHYGHRPAAGRAAWTKFVISRIGDAALLVAICLIYREFGTLGFAKLFDAIGEASGAVSPMMNAASILLVVGAVTKSAQVPFHTWLPQTMETPTPVSALMHAGIVNAGGYLIIRTSPLVVMTSWSLSLLTIVGAVTTCFAAVVMLTQTSIKKSLAYSTIAQMGFMILQCGLGAFSAAMLHILAHSLYKAHAFLSSGSVISERSATSGADSEVDQVSWTRLAMGGAVVAGLLGIAFATTGIDVRSKPGGLLLGGIFCLALTHWIGQVMRTGNRQLLIRSLTVAGAMCFVYAVSFQLVDKTIASGLPSGDVLGPGPVAVGLVWFGFLGMFAIQILLAKGAQLAWMKSFYVHALNGFYIENSMRRIFGPLSSV